VTEGQTDRRTDRRPAYVNNVRSMTEGGSVKKQPRWNSMAVEHGCSNIEVASSNAFTRCDPVILTFCPDWWARYRDGLSLD